MKKSLLALAVLAASGVAMAQSSVTLFGVVDLSVNHIKNGSTSNWTMASNNLNSNRLGFRGTEDLGGGLTAGFWLEAGMSNQNGNIGGSNGQTAPSAGTTMFNRRSTASLMGSFGEVRVGRDYVPTFWNTAVDDAYGANGLGEALDTINYALGSAAMTQVRDNNTVAYFLPGNIGGFYGSAMVGLGQGVAGQKYTGARMGYGNGPLDVNIAFANTKTATTDDLKVVNFGGSYDFAVVKMFAFYNKTTYGAVSQKTVSVSGSVPVTAAGSLLFTINKSDYSGTLSGTAKHYGLEYVQNLSKRTALYAGVARIDNSGAAKFSVGGQGPAIAAGQDSNGYNVGLKTSF